jgi:hypothetical protein
MSVPTQKVELTFGTASWVDVTTRTNSVRISRGVDRALTDFQPGTCDINFQNTDRTFDPTYQSSILWVGGTAGYSIVQPGATVRVSAGSLVQFVGKISSWSFTNDEKGLYALTDASAQDLLADLGRAQFPANGTVAANTTGWQIYQVAQTYGTVDSTELDYGQTMLPPQPYSVGDNVLNYLQNVARSEVGDVYAQSNNTLAFHDRSFSQYTFSGGTQYFNYVTAPNADLVTFAQATAAGWSGGATAIVPMASALGSNTSTSPTGTAAFQGVWQSGISSYDNFFQSLEPSGSKSYSAGTYTASLYYWSANTSPVLSLALTGQGVSFQGSTALSVANKTWTRIQVSTVATAAFDSFSIDVNGTANVPQYVTGVQFEKGATANSYFDGNSVFQSSGVTRQVQPTWFSQIGQSASSRATQTGSFNSLYSYITFADVNSQGTAYGNGTALPIFDLVMSYNSEQLYNQINITNSIGGTVTATNTNSTALYGPRSYTISSLATNNQRLQTIANDLDGQYSKPEYRAESVTIAVETLTTAQQAILLNSANIGIHKLVRVIFQPSRMGQVIDKIYQVLKIDHDMQIETHRMTLMLGSLDNLPARADSTLFAVTNQAIAS